MRLRIAHTLPIMVLLGTLGAGPTGASRAWAASPDARFQKLADEFLDGWLARHPQWATRLGVHAAP